MTIGVASSDPIVKARLEPEMGVVTPLTTTAVPEAGIEYVVPEIVRADPCERVCEAMIYPAVSVTGDIKEGVVEATPSTSNAVPSPSETEYVVPATVIAEPGRKVFPAPATGIAVVAVDPTVVLSNKAPNVEVSELITIIFVELPKEYTVLSIVTAGPPGAKVVDPRVYTVAESGVIVSDPITSGGALYVGSTLASWSLLLVDTSPIRVFIVL